DDASGGLLPRTLAFSTHAASETSRTMRVGALVGREAASAFVARRHLPPPVPHPLIEPMPQQTKLALWTNWFDLKDLWDWLRQQAGDEVAALMTSIGQQASEATGKSLDDFFDVFGGEFGVMITGQPVAHQAPRLLGGLVVTVRDRPAAAAMIARMVAGLQVITVKASDLDISSVLLVGGLLQPAYALLERHLILADNAELVEAVRRQLLHGDGTDGGATGEPDLARRQGNVAVFLRVGEMIERLTPLLTLAGREMDERNRMASPEAYRLMREIGPPVLAALRNLATARFHGALAEDILFMELEYTLQRD
ncbi:MAG: hypothetical protein FWC49_05230, partial [Proteobacteria bacterium]|nr:hypothetical protein [Pseudomonadota bacterium]